MTIIDQVQLDKFKNKIKDKAEELKAKSKTLKGGKKGGVNKKNTPFRKKAQ